MTDAIKYFFDNKDFLKNLISNTSGQNSFINYVTQFNAEILSDYIKRSQNISELSPETEIFVKVYCYGTVCIICEYIMKNLPIPVEDFIDLLEKSLPEPLKKYLYKNAEI